MNRRPILGHFEYDVLRALLAFPEENYGSALAEQMARPQGAVATTLYRLETKGLVASTWEEAPRDIVGGRRRRHFTITPLGENIVRETAKHFQTT